jgi:hypothetical protein
MMAISRMIVNSGMITDRPFAVKPMDAATAFGRRPYQEIEYAARADLPFSSLNTMRRRACS